MPGDNLDIFSEPVRRAAPKGEAERKQRFLGVKFACCDVYSRIYVNREGTAYEGRCPKCFKPLQILIGPGGSDSRFFTAY